jgi:hypothetical protein
LRKCKIYILFITILNRESCAIKVNTVFEDKPPSIDTASAGALDRDQTAAAASS